MPKGGALHLHTSSTAPARWIIDEGIREPGCCVCWPADCGDSIRGQLGFFRPGEAPAGYQSVQAVLTAEADFPQQLLELITINESDAKLTSGSIWQKFNAIFQRVGGLLDYQPVFMKYYAAAFRTLLDDNVCYVELRAGFGELHDLAGNTWDAGDRARLLWDLRNEVRKTKPQFDVKLIYSGYRSMSAKAVWSQIEQAVDLRTAWAEHNFILGFDLVGDEDAGHRTKAFLGDWVRLKAYLAQRQATLPLYFHDGESDWASDANLYDAFLLGSRRIGHGFDLFRFPTLQAGVKRNQVAIEVCPISNQQLRYVSDLRTHPAVGYLNEGIPCILSNDDPGVFGNDGLSYDFWEATVAWNLNLAALKQLAWNALYYSGMTEAEKSTAISHWQQAWNDWVEVSLAGREP
jgi:adenosine deaminase CECR1